MIMYALCTLQYVIGARKKQASAMFRTTIGLKIQCLNLGKKQESFDDLVNDYNTIFTSGYFM